MTKGRYIVVSKKGGKRREYTRNILLVLLAVIVVVIFFNLDVMRKGESVFSKTAEQKLRLTGDLDRKSLSRKEIGDLIDFITRYDELYETVTIDTTLQDPYKPVTDDSQILYEVRVGLHGGSALSTPARRVTRKELVEDILFKLRKDTKAYFKVKDSGRRIKELVNTM